MSLVNFIYRHSGIIGLLYSIILAMEQGFSPEEQNFSWWGKFREDVMDGGRTNQKLEIILKLCIIGTIFVCATAIICFCVLLIRKLVDFVANSKNVVVQCYP